MKSQLIKPLVLILVSVVLAGCASTTNYPEANRIMIMTTIPSREYEVLGIVQAKAYTMFQSYTSPGAVNPEIQQAAYRMYGDRVDAVIGVQYHEVKGFTSGETIGTTGIGNAIRYK